MIPEDFGQDDEKDDKDEKFEGGGGIDRPPAPRRMAHTGTLDPSVAGRTKCPLSADVSHDLAKPTQLFPAPKGLQPSSSTNTTTTIPRVLPSGRIYIAVVATSLT